MKQLALRTAVFALATAVLPAVAGAQNIVVNPGFELGANNVGGFSGANILGFSIDDGGTFPPGCQDDEAIAYSFNRRSGNFGLQFGGFGCVNGVFQNLATTAGTTYDIDFYVRNAGVDGISTPADMSFSAFFGANTIFDGYLTPSNDLSYTHVTGSFTATSSSTKLDFLSENDNSFTYLDDITVQAETTATPEPASMTLLGIGLAGLAGLSRLRSRRA